MAESARTIGETVPTKVGSGTSESESTVIETPAFTEVEQSQI